MRIRLGYAMELVVVVASGLALARSTLGDPSLRRYLGADSTDLPGFLLIDTTLGGIAVAGGIGLAIEAVRRRSPPSWDIGRWCWAVAAMTVVLRAASVAISMGLPTWKDLGRRSFDASSALFHARLSLAWTFTRSVGLPFAAAAIVALIVRSKGITPDAREWAGRALLAAISALALTYPWIRGLVE